jgi:hypothetical protein
MRKNRFLTRLSSGSFVVAVAAGAVLLTDGVSHAASPTRIPQVMVAAPATTTTVATTKLDTSPSSPVTYGTQVTLTATISAAPAGAAPAGVVQFKDGSTPLNSPVPVSYSTASNGTVTGTASTSTPDLTPGTHSLTAMFIPSDPTLTSTSPSNSVNFTVTPSPGTTTTCPTTTILHESPGTTDLLSPFKVELAAKLTDSCGKSLDGQLISFYGDDHKLLGQATTDKNGVAQCSAQEDPLAHIVYGITAGYVAYFPGDGIYLSSTQHAPGTIEIFPSGK